MIFLCEGKRYLTPLLGVVFVGVVSVGVFPSVVFAAPLQTTLSSNKVMGPTNGLVGYWTFNGPDINWTTNTVLDRSGQGNNGLMVNMATKTSPVGGKLGQGLKFLPSPTVDYINAGSASSLDNLSAMTVSMWVNSTDKNGVRTLVQKADAQTPLGVSGWRLELTPGTMNFSFSVGCNSTPLIAVSNSVASRPGWHFVAVTYTGGITQTSVDFSIDGVHVGTSISGINGSSSRGDDNGADVTLGGYEWQPSYNLNGVLDDVRIYNRILTPTEITQLYNVGQVKLATPTKVLAKPGSGLVGWWTFDGPDVNWTTNTALDKSGNGNNGTLGSGAPGHPTPIAGKLGQALLFNTSKNPEVFVSQSSSINNIVSMSFSLWVKPGNPSVDSILLTKYNTPSAGWSLLSGAGRVLQFEAPFTGGWGTWRGPTVNRNQWQHVVVTYDHSSASNNPVFYFNGVATTTSVVGTPTGTYKSDSAFYLGIGGRHGYLSDAFDGSLDDVRIYNRILTPAEIAQLYKAGQVTLTPFTCGVSTVKDADNNTYNTVKIGTQCWMKQNMRVGTMVNVATNQTNNGIIEKHCYSGTLANCMTNNDPNYPDGGLYQWNEAMQYSTTPGARGICPAGWHIPTHDQLTTLERNICTSGTCATDFPYNTSTVGYRGTTEGTKLKANGTSGFEGNLAGYSFSGSFDYRGTLGFFWSSSESGAVAWVRGLFSASTQVDRSTDVKSLGFSVRCLKD